MSAALPSGPGLETQMEYDQDFCFGLLFLGIAIFAIFRVFHYFDPSGGGRVITLFYFLIFLCSATRAIWFLVPNYSLEVSYTPTAQIAWITVGWKGTFVSELLEATGSLTLYAVFILVTCYWAHMMKKVNMEAMEPHRVAQSKGIWGHRFGAISTFLVIFSVIVSFELVNIGLFLTQVTNSEEMIMIDSLLLSIVAVFAGIFMTILSSRIRVLLMTIGAMNPLSANTRPHVNRILYMTRVGNAFFVVRIAVECALAISCILLMRAHKSFSVVLSDKYWEIYLFVKHVSEIMVLFAQLVISTAIKHYDNYVPRVLQTTGAIGTGVQVGKAPVPSRRRGDGTTTWLGPTPKAATELTPMLGPHTTATSYQGINI